MEFPVDTSYDELVIRYENAKQLIHEIAEAFRTNSSNLERVINEYTTDSNNEFVTALKTEITNIGTSVQSLFANGKDPGLWKATKLEEKLQSYEMEKSLGYKQMNDLKKECQILKEEKENWSIREQKGKKMIQECQIQIEMLKNKDTNDTNNDQNNHIHDSNNNNNDEDDSNNNHSITDTNVIELTDELELAQRNAAELRQMVDQLTSENKSLSHQVLSLREETQTQMSEPPSNQNAEELTSQIQNLLQDRDKYQSEVSELRAICGEYRRKLESRGLSSKHLYRNDTMTSWDDANLDDLKGDMLAEFQKLAHDNLVKQSDAQMELRFNDKINEDVEEEYAPKKVVISESSSDDANRVYRSDTLTEWDQEKLNEMTSSMKRELQELVSEDKKTKIFEMTENQLLMNESGSNANANAKNEKNDIKMLESKESSSAMEMKESEKFAMQKQFLAMKQERLKSQIETNYDLMTQEQDGFDNKMIAKPEDSDEIRAQIIAMRSVQLEKQSQVEYTEPQIRENHWYEFRDLMKSIGIINESIVSTLWTQIANTIRPMDNDDYDDGDSEDDDGDGDDDGGDDDDDVVVGSGDVATNDANVVELEKVEQHMIFENNELQNELQSQLTETEKKFERACASKSQLAQQCATEICRLSMVINALLQLPRVKDTVQMLIEESYKL